MGVQRVIDTFTEASSDTTLASHTPDTGTGWTLEEQTGSVTATVLYNTDSMQAGNENGDRLLYSSQPNPSDNNDTEYDVQVNLEYDDPAGDDPFFLFARFVDTNNYYAALRYPINQAADMKIFKKVTGAVTEIASGDSGASEADDTTHIFKLRNSTNRQEYLFDEGGLDETTITADDTDLTSAGKCGIGWGNALDSGDDITSPWTFTSYYWEEQGAGTSHTQTVSESITITDSLLKTWTAELTPTESVSISDSISRVWTANRILTESVGIADSLQTVKSLIQTLTETINVADSILRVWTAERIVPESISISDSILRVWTAQKTLTESVSISDSISSFNVIIRFLTEGISISDSITKLSDSVRLLTENISILDNLIRIWTIKQTLTESISIVDTVSVSRILSGIVLNESISITANSTLKAVTNRILTESLSLDFNLRWVGGLGRKLSVFSSILSDDISDTFSVGSSIFQDDISDTFSIGSQVMLDDINIKGLGSTILQDDIANKFSIGSIFQDDIRTGSGLR